jgi:hypothetical protein
VTTEKPPEAADPNAIPEVFCAGPVNLVITGAVSTLTFMHIRKSAANIFKDFTPETTECVVKARVIMPIEDLVALKDLIDRMVKVEPIAPGSTAAY